MNDDDIDWSGQESNERQRFEEEQALLKADPDYVIWLDAIDNERINA